MSILSQHSNKVLIVEEQVSAERLSNMLSRCGYDVCSRKTESGAVAALEKGNFDVLITNLSTDRVDGLTLLHRALKLDPLSEVIIVTEVACVNTAVKSIKEGAYHFLVKPYGLDEINIVVREALQKVNRKRNNLRLATDLTKNQSGPHIISQDAEMQKLLDTARQIAPTDCNVVITGESGTGKELIARFIHHHSHRANAPLIAFNCAALQEELVTNELFGHEKGAYTGATEARAGLIEAANGGTLFLDEIAEMSLSMQVKLLRVVQERELQRVGSTTTLPVDVRIIAATNRDLQEEVKTGRFRQDLFFRLDVVRQHLPPLAERRDDIPLLAYYFLKKNSLRMGRSIEDFSSKAMALLCDYDYPGNVRELENIIERGVALSKGAQLLPSDLPPELEDHSVQVFRRDKKNFPTLLERESDYIQWILRQTGGNRSKAAEILGIDRVSLWRKLKNC